LTSAAKTTFGAFLVAGAFAAIAGFQHEFWPSAQSPPQQIKTIQKTDTAVQPEAKDTAVQSEPATQDFADYAKTGAASRVTTSTRRPGAPVTLNSRAAARRCQPLTRKAAPAVQSDGGQPDAVAHGGAH
jgi:hypothetical protein